jgi:signal peptidase I
VGFKKSRRLGAASKRQRPFARRIRKLAILVLWVFVAHTVFTSLIADSISVDSASMLPGCEPGDRFITSPLWYGPLLPFVNQRLPGIFSPRRGDLALILAPYAQRPAFPNSLLRKILGFFTGRRTALPSGKRPGWQNDLVLRRIIALPGDTVRIRGGEAFVKAGTSPDFVSEFSLSLIPYKTTPQSLPPDWDPTAPLGGPVEETVLGETEYFVLCDNRGGGLDSRLWGPVQAERVVTKVLLRYWPLGSRD